MTVHASGTENSPPSPFSLKRVVDLWLEGEWPLLAMAEELVVSTDPDRAMIACYVAVANQFCDRHSAGRYWAEMALKWGISLEYLVQVLTAGTRITQARMAAIAGDVDRACALMSKTAGPVPGERATASVDARISKELATMGLLLLATEVVSEDLDATIATPGAYGNRHRIAVLKSELIQIRQQLALHQSRRQMGGGSRDESLSDPQLALRNSMSQLGQDIWVLEQSMYKRRGYFVEFGATDGILLSNTFMLEKQFAWTGLLAEPNPGYFRELQRNRSSLAVDACIAAKTGDIVDFVLADEFGGMKDYISRDRHAARRESYASVPEGILTLSTISLDDFLRTNGAPKKIDYVSVDTEGSELDILSAFPFEKWDVRLWTIEHNFTPDRKEIFELMSSHGYLRKEVQFDDWYYKAEP